MFKNIRIICSFPQPGPPLLDQFDAPHPPRLHYTHVKHIKRSGASGRWEWVSRSLPVPRYSQSCQLLSMVMTAHLGAALTNQRPEHKCGAEQFCPGCKNIGERKQIRRFNWNCVVRPGCTQENFQFCLPWTGGGGGGWGGCFGSWDTRSKTTKPVKQLSPTSVVLMITVEVVKKILGCDVLVPPLKHTHFSVKRFFSRSSQSLQQQEQTQK